jgi:hypothetical protein
MHIMALPVGRKCERNGHACGNPTKPRLSRGKSRRCSPARAATACVGHGADFHMTEGMLEGLRNCTREGRGMERGQGLGERQEWG